MPSFQRSARAFTEYLSRLLTRTITPNHPLKCSFLAGNQARITFRERYAPLEHGCMLGILQTIGPHPTDTRKVTTLDYSYAFIIGTNPDTDWFVRYEYVPKEEANPAYPYPIGHMHINAAAAHYEQYIAPFENKAVERIHFPAGRISVEDLIELLIVEFHIPVAQGDRQSALRWLRESRNTFHSEKRTKR